MRYTERLTPPPAWWVLAALGVLCLGVAIGVYLGPWWGLAALAASGGGAALLFTTAATRVDITATELAAGRAHIALGHLHGCRPLDAAGTAARTGVDADARAFLVLRPYVRTAVEVTLADPADPTPYWLISSRRPAELARTLSLAISANAPNSPGAAAQVG